MLPTSPVRTAHDRLRRRAAQQLQSRVAGPEAMSRADRIWRAPGERPFAPTDPIWRVHADAAMFAAGIRALLLQSLHPLAMAGVAQHSTYLADPWARLQSTSEFISQTTFGTRRDTERLLARIRGIHRRVNGVAPDGRAYRADDPELLAWVHAAEAESFLTCHQRFGARPLTPTEADTYVAQIAGTAARLGVPDPPRSVADLHAALGSFRPQLRASEDARTAAHFVMTMPALPRSSRAGYRLLVAAAVSTLPRFARDELGIRAPQAAVPLLHQAGRLGVGGVRWMLSDPMVLESRLPAASAGEPATSGPAAGLSPAGRR